MSKLNQVDLKQTKVKMINGILSISFIIGMFLCGFLSKEIMIILLANKGINKITTILVG